MTAPATVTPGVETKVKVASAATYLGLVATLSILQAISDANLVAALPPVVSVFVAPLVPTAITFVAAYLARHTPRPADPAAGTVVQL